MGIYLERIHDEGDFETTNIKPSMEAFTSRRGLLCLRYDKPNLS